MQSVLLTIIRLLPIWFGVGFLGSVMAELILRTPLHMMLAEWNGAEFTPSMIYTICMSVGGVYGLFALLTGRWI